MRKRFETEGADAFTGSPAEFAAALQKELDGWRKVVREGGLKLE